MIFEIQIYTDNQLVQLYNARRMTLQISEQLVKVTLAKIYKRRESQAQESYTGLP